MATLFLRPAVHLARVGDDLVSLDVEADVYGCIPGIGHAVPPPGAGGRLDLVSAEDADALLEAGLVTREPCGAEWPAPPPRPTSSCWRAKSVAVTPADRRRFTLAYLAATPTYWRSRFGVLVAAARRRPTMPGMATPGVWRDAQVFDQLLPLAPFQGECLFRAFLLLAYLRREGQDAAWVFGVRTYPFQAHCWLQVGDTALNDAVERIGGYTPILAV